MHFLVCALVFVTAYLVNRMYITVFYLGDYVIVH